MKAMSLLALVLFGLSSLAQAEMTDYETCLNEAYSRHDNDVYGSKMRYKAKISECEQMNNNEEEALKCKEEASKIHQQELEDYRSVLNRSKRFCLRYPMTLN